MRLQPLTERILGALPGQRWTWIALWSLVPAMNAGANALLGTEGAVWDQSTEVVVLNYAALTVGVFISVWGTGRIARRLDGLRTERFEEIGSVRGPLLATVAAAVAFGIGAGVEDGVTSGVLRGLTWIVLGAALWTFVWTYLWLQLGLDRLGRDQLVRDEAHVDPGLGLQPLGAVAFMGLWMLLAWLIPLVLTGLPDDVGFALGMLVLAGGLGFFFLSLWRLHRQMVDIKANEVAMARELYAEAYEPVRTARTLAVLEEQRNLLGAAEALEKRARAIHEWPIDEGTFARVMAIATSVAAITVGRLILDPFGL